MNQSIFPGGILEERVVDETVATSLPTVTEDSNEESFSNDGSDYDIEVSTFLHDEDLDEYGRSPTDDLVDNNQEKIFISDG